MSEDHQLPDGTVINIHAAGPHEHRSPFYVFVMDRPGGQLQFPELKDGPMLSHIEIAGRDADLWHSRLAEWLCLPSQDGRLVVGNALIGFTKSSDERLQVTPTFMVAGDPDVLPPSDGSLRLVNRA